MNYNVVVKKIQRRIIMKIKEILKGIIISIITLAVGYAAMAIPFNLFLSVSKDGQRIFFLIELSVYFVVGCIFLLIQDKKEKQAEKEKERHRLREEKIKNVQENWYNIAA